MADDDELTLLRAENQAVRAQRDQVRAQRAQVSDQWATAPTRIAALEQQRSALPPFVTPNKPAPSEPKRKRKQRAPAHPHGRRRMTPLRSVAHALDRCPTCDYLLQGASLDDTRAVIALPKPHPVEGIDHRIIKRCCPHCPCGHRPKLELRGHVLGQGRIGVRIASRIAYRRTRLRRPIRRIQASLHTGHPLVRSAGERVELLHPVRRTLQPTIDALNPQARARPILHGDETGWRETGRNGSIWAFSTPGDNAVRSYGYDHRRGQAVVKRIRDGRFDGQLVRDFYGGSPVDAGKHQRCWVHLLRDLHDLKVQHADQADVITWATARRAEYAAAQAWRVVHSAANRAAREAHDGVGVAASHALGRQSAQACGHPGCALTKRRLRHEDAVFPCVLVAGRSADTNAAERSIRPRVLIGKMSGGTRSRAGTKPRMGLASLFET